MTRDASTVKHVCPGSSSYLRCAFYWLRAGLSARSLLDVVGRCCACNHRSAAGRGDDHGNDRNGDCALVRIYVRVHRERHARAVRSAKKTLGNHEWTRIDMNFQQEHWCSLV